MSPADDALKTELAALRRQVRAQLLLLACTLALAAASFWRAVVPSAAPPPDADEEVLVGRSLYLREHPDEPYVRLKFLSEGAGLVLSDAQGRGQVQVVAMDGRGRLTLGSGPSRVELDADPAAPGLTLRDREGRPRIVLTAGEPARVVLLDAGSRPRLEMAAGGVGAVLSLKDARGRAILELRQDEAGGTFTLRDASGKVLRRP